MKIGVPEGDGGGGGGGAPMHETRGGAGTDPTTAGTQDGEEEPSHESQLRSLLESPESCGSGPAAASASPCTCELAGGPCGNTATDMALHGSDGGGSRTRNHALGSRSCSVHDGTAVCDNYHIRIL